MKTMYPEGEQLVADISRNQLQKLTEADPRCRGLELPEGILLRYALDQSMYFYLRTGVRDGKIATRIFASDTPYDPQRTTLGEVKTMMFEPLCDAVHLDKIQRLLYQWVDFVKGESEAGVDFRSFEMDNRTE